MTADAFGIVGTTQGPYRVESVVAEGGFGVVYRAHHDAFRAPVALKCLKVPGKLTPESQEAFLERFREEAEVMFRLSASIPAVVRPLHVDFIATEDGQFVPFMALEWLDGETLDDLVARRRSEGRPPLSLRRLVRMLAPVARALERAHNFPGAEGTVSIAHCDLKPDNIFVTEVDGITTVKILDFGIANVRSEASQIVGRVTSSAEKGSAFTPGYAAPEQWLPKRFGQAGPWTDVWGLAVTVLEAALGRPLIDGDHSAMMAVTIDEARRPTPRAEGLEVSDEVEEVFRRAVEVDPRKRYPDVGFFWDALERALGLEETSGSVVRRDRRAEGAGPTVREERVDLGRATFSSIVPPPSVRRSSSRSTEARESSDPPPVSDAPPSLAPPSFELALEPPPSARPSREAPPVRTPAAPVRTPRALVDGSSALNLGGEVELRDDGAAQPALELDTLSLHDSGPASFRASFDGRALTPASHRGLGPLRPATEGPDLKRRLAKPLRFAFLGFTIGVGEQVYVQAFGGEAIALGPLRLIWLAGALVLWGTALVLYRIFWPVDE